MNYRQAEIKNRLELEDDYGPEFDVLDGFVLEDVLTMARTLWGECRSEPREGQVAVAWVIRNRAFVDCGVSRVGDLIYLQGYAQMEFTQDDAKAMAYGIIDRLDHPYQEVRPVAVPGNTPVSGDAIVDETINKLLARSKLGQEKYGTTLMRNDLSLLDWMRHAIEESLDRTLYMIRALKDLEQLYDDGR